VDSQFISFTLVPMLNAAGRLESARTAYRLLTESRGLADIALELKTINDKRKSLQQKAVDEAVSEVRRKYRLCDTRVIIVSGKGWNKGIVGLIAARLAEQFTRPAIAFSEEDGVLTGSGRSIAGVDLFHALSSMEELFTRFGGHQMAAGLTLKKDNLAEMEERLNRHFFENYDSDIFVKKYIYDEIITEKSVNINVAEELECFEPCGHMNPSPVFLWKGAKVAGQRFLSEGKHSKLSIEGTAADVMCFNRSERIEVGEACDLLGDIGINEFRGKCGVQFITRALERKGLMYVDDAQNMRSVLSEIRALADIFKNTDSYALQHDNAAFFGNVLRDMKASALGTIAIADTHAGRTLLADMQVSTLDAVPCDTAENAFVLSSKGKESLKNYAKIYSVGCFALADTAHEVLFSRELLENMKNEICEYYISDERIHAHAKAFESLGVCGYERISDYLRAAADAAGERSIEPLWLSANIFQELELLAVKKSDRIFFKYFCKEYELSNSALYMSVKRALDGITKELVHA